MPEINIASMAKRAEVRRLLTILTRTMKEQGVDTTMGMVIGLNIAAFMIARSNPSLADRQEMLQRALTALPMYIDAYTRGDLTILE